MYNAKKHIPRRMFLRTAGCTLALPLLDAMVPASTALAATAAVPKPRFVGIFFPHGTGNREPKARCRRSCRTCWRGSKKSGIRRRW